jgi:FdhD protein
MKPCDAEGLQPHAPLVQVWVQPGESLAGRFEEVAEETPVALTMNGVSQAVMMATPSDLEDFAFGFALTEGWVDHRHQLLDVEIQATHEGAVIDLTTTAACDHRQRARRRSLAGRTGCGLCGVESLEQMKPPRSARATAQAPVAVDPDALARASLAFHRHQHLQARCGGMHAAAWCDRDGELLLVREDVGRHNALDKLIGALMREDAALDGGFVLMSSRCSYELVVKVSAARIGALACVSAPTAHAVRTAAACGVTLWGFVREGRASRYA